MAKRGWRLYDPEKPWILYVGAAVVGGASFVGTALASAWGPEPTTVPTPSSAGQRPPQVQTIGTSLSVYDFDQDGRVDAVESASPGELQLLPTRQGTDWPAVLAPALATVVAAGITGVVAYSAGRRRSSGEVEGPERG